MHSRGAVYSEPFVTRPGVVSALRETNAATVTLNRTDLGEGDNVQMPHVYAIPAFPKEITLRDGTKVSVRPLEEGDAEELLAFFLELPEGDRYFLKDDVTSPEQIREWTQSLNYDRALPLIAVADGRLVAEAVLVRRRGNARSHVGEVRVTVLLDFRSRGLGTALIRHLCDIADDAGLDRVMFEIVADKEAEALKAAEWMGFLRVGTIEGGARDPSGHAHDIILLTMPLGKWYQWTKF
jgi:L-amino acid N-acyltransferase YncA